MPLNVQQSQVTHVARISTGAHIVQNLMEQIRNEYERYAAGQGDEPSLAALVEANRQVFVNVAAQWQALRSSLGLS